MVNCLSSSFSRRFFHAVFSFTLISKLIQMAFIKEVPQFTIIINTESWLHNNIAKAVLNFIHLHQMCAGFDTNLSQSLWIEWNSPAISLPGTVKWCFLAFCRVPVDKTIVLEPLKVKWRRVYLVVRVRFVFYSFFLFLHHFDQARAELGHQVGGKKNFHIFLYKFLTYVLKS